MSNQSVDAAASTSNTRKKLTDEERKARDREYSRRYRAAGRDKVAAATRHTRNTLPKEELLRRRREQQRLYRLANRDNEAYRERRRATSRKWAANNSDQVATYGRQYRHKNQEALREKKKCYVASNKEKVLAAKRKQKARRYKQDTVFRLEQVLRTRINRAIKKQSKSGSAVQDMGCTGQQACAHLESLFDEHMTWDNWGTYWQVDHVYPLSKANLEDRIEFLAVVNWRNLQPLEKSENNRKNDTVTPEAQKLFDDLKTQFLKEDK